MALLLALSKHRMETSWAQLFRSIPLARRTLDDPAISSTVDAAAKTLGTFVLP